MIYRKCSIGGQIYNGDYVEDEKELPSDHSSLNEKKKRTHLNAEKPLDDLRSSGSSTAADHKSPKKANNDTSNDAPVDGLESAEPVSTATAPPKVVHHFRDAQLTRDLEAAVHADQGSSNAAHARNLNGFFSVLALCHTVLTSVNQETGQLEYKAQSPDEAALVQAAADMGFVFRGREREVLYLQTPFGNAGMDEDIDISGRRSDSPSRPGSSGSGKAAGAPPLRGGGVLAGQLYDEGTLERYELLNILEFTSARKRMSVVLRKLDSDDGRLFLLSKGADNVIFERLKQGSGEELKKTTERHLDEFAGQGLRTLTLAYKILGGVFLSLVLFVVQLSDVILFRGRV